MNALPLPPRCPESPEMKEAARQLFLPTQSESQEQEKTPQADTEMRVLVQPD